MAANSETEHATAEQQAIILQLDWVNDRVDAVEVDSARPSAAMSGVGSVRSIDAPEIICIAIEPLV